MKLKMLVRSLAFTFLAAGAVLAHAAGEDTYPDKPIKFVVTFPPGGGTEMSLRIPVAAAPDPAGAQAVLT